MESKKGEKMRHINKIVYIISLIILICMLIGLVCIKIMYTNNNLNNDTSSTNDSTFEHIKIPDDAMINEQPGITQEKELDGILISNFKLVQNERAIILVADVTNQSNSETKNSVEKKILFLDEANNQVGAISIYIPTLKVGEKKEIYSEIVYDMILENETEFIKFDITKAYQYRVEDYIN